MDEITNVMLWLTFYEALDENFLKINKTSFSEKGGKKLDLKLTWHFDDIRTKVIEYPVNKHQILFLNIT